MKVYKRFITYSYLKSFFIIFFALQIFYTAVDVIPTLKEIDNSANLKVLYITFEFLNAINITLPLSILFALILSKFKMIRSNELLALYSLGISKRDVIKPLFFVSIIITISYILLNMTPFVYVNSYAKNIKRFNTIQKGESNIFLKYYNSYIYFGKFNKLKKEANKIHIYRLKDRNLIEIIKAKKAYYKKDFWELRDVEIIRRVKKDKNIFLLQKKIEVYPTLYNFKPQIIKSIYGKKDESAITISDAIIALKLFHSQNIDTSKLRANLYKMVFFPLFAPFLLIILFYHLPVSIRFFNLAYISSIFFITSIVTWGILHLLSRISINMVIPPEIGIIAPIIIIIIYSIYLYKREK